MTCACDLSSSPFTRRSYTPSSTPTKETRKSSRRSRTPDWKTETKHLEAGAFENTNRRPIDWSLNFDKYQSEEHRLREHVRELAEQNVTLQREISGLIEESENQSTVTNCEQELKDQTMRLNELKKQNQDLSDSLVQLKEECNTGRDFLLD